MLAVAEMDTKAIGAVLCEDSNNKLSGICDVWFHDSHYLPHVLMLRNILRTGLHEKNRFEREEFKNNSAEGSHDTQPAVALRR